jgi:hypothetical protein
MSPGWLALLMDAEGPITTPERAREAMREISGDEQVEADDAEQGLWLVTLTDEQAAKLQGEGYIEIETEHFQLDAETGESIRSIGPDGVDAF